jgi:ketosteroid isomerase-like protein
MRFIFAACLGLLLAACVTPVESGEREIRERIFSIRDAIRVKNAEGVVHWGTDDWSFTGPDGKSFDRPGYLARTRELFTRIVSIDSLETTIDSIAIDGATAAVEITQRMERQERNGTTGLIERVRLLYRERHEWRKTGDGWRVRAVRFIGTLQRTVIPAVP